MGVEKCTHIAPQARQSRYSLVAEDMTSGCNCGILYINILFVHSLSLSDRTKRIPQWNLHIDVFSGHGVLVVRWYCVCMCDSESRKEEKLYLTIKYKQCVLMDRLQMQSLLLLIWWFHIQSSCISVSLWPPESSVSLLGCTTFTPRLYLTHV